MQTRLWLNWLLVLTLLLAGQSVVAEDAEEGDAAQLPKVRIMSFNITRDDPQAGENAWDKRRELVVETITAVDPDILSTQDGLAHQMQWLSTQLRDYAAVGVGRLDGRAHGEFNTIFFKRSRFRMVNQGHFWLSDTPNRPGSGWDDDTPEMVTWVELIDNETRKNVVVMNTRFFNTQRRRAPQNSAVMMREGFNELLAQDKAIIVTGDFRIGVGTRPHILLCGDVLEDEVKLSDTFIAVHAGRQRNTGTEHDFEGSHGGRRSTWILASRHFTTLEADLDRTEKEGRYPSACFPLYAVVQWKETNLPSHQRRGR